jgi:hypothetical protein
MPYVPTRDDATSMNNWTDTPTDAYELSGIYRKGELTPKERNKKWASLRTTLKKEFESMGITRCEICGDNFALSFAHSRKRRFITTMALLREVALLCHICHETVEHSGHEQMFTTITSLISSRAAR